MAAPRSKQDEARMRALRSLVLAGEDETARELAVRFGLELPSVAVALAA